MFLITKHLHTIYKSTEDPPVISIHLVVCKLKLTLVTVFNWLSYLWQINIPFILMCDIHINWGLCTINGFSLTNHGPDQWTAKLKEIAIHRVIQLRCVKAGEVWELVKYENWWSSPNNKNHVQRIRYQVTTKALRWAEWMNEMKWKMKHPSYIAQLQ